jgi:sortase A
MKNNKSNIKSDIIISLLTPLFLTILCGAITMLALIMPYQKAKVYLSLAFMDNLQTLPEDNGLNITSSDIDTEVDGPYYSEGEIDIPSFGQQYAVLECKSIDMTVPVYWGSTDELLELGACQASSSVVIGETGNVVIDAHIDTFFSDLENLSENDEVTLYTSYGKFVYTVKNSIAFMKTDKTYITPKEDDCLTLYTCKREVLGSSDARTGFVCELKEKDFYTEKQD